MKIFFVCCLTGLFLNGFCLANESEKEPAPIRSLDRLLHTELVLSDEELLEKLLKLGANPNTVFGLENTTPLIEACQDHHPNLGIVKMLLKWGADPNALSKNNICALDCAARAKDASCLSLLLENGASACLDREDRNPLVNAIAHENRTAIALLLSHGADINKQHFETSPLMMAIQLRHRDLVDELLKKEVEIQPSIQNPLLIYTAVRYGDPSLLETLVNRGADVHATHPYYNNEILLQVAVEIEKPEIVQFLLDRGWKSKINIENCQGITPLIEAVIQHSKKIVGLLLENGADPNYVSTNGGTPLGCCTCSYVDSSIVSMLLESGANPNLCGANGYTPLHSILNNSYHVREPFLPIIQRLIEKGANPNAKNIEGDTPLQIAATVSLQSIVEYLLPFADFAEEPGN